MQLEFISNTGCYLEHDGAVLGMDIWLTQGPFEGSWFHFPPLRETKFSIADCDYIYISHIHPDHYDQCALTEARPDAIFIVPDYFNNLLARKLNAFGCSNVISLAPGEQTTLPCGARVTMYDQFINNLFADAAFGGLIDSAIMIEWDGRTILNCNDNYLTEAAARDIIDAHPDIDLAMMPHSASGPYPASFRNLDLAEKQAEVRRLQEQYIAHFVAMTNVLKPRLVVPCAAEYAIVGRQFEKNPYIGLASPAAAARAVNAQPDPVRGRTQAVHLDCGTILDIESGAVTGHPVREPNESDKFAFAEALKDVPYPYEWDTDCNDVADMDRLMELARAHMWDKQRKLGWTSDYNIYIGLNEQPVYEFNFAHEGVNRLDGVLTERREPYLECFLSRQLMHSILTRKAHWNNAEGGLHIDFHRAPNIYVPEVFTLLSFLHAPADDLDTDGPMPGNRRPEQVA